MTLPAFQAIGTGHETSIAWPTHVAGHFGLCFIEHPDSTITTPSGWAIVPGFPISIAASVRLSAFYRFATSAAESNFAVTGSPDHNYGVIVTFTGVNTLNPFHVVSTSISNSNTNKWFSGITTYLNDCLIVNALAWQIDNAGPLSSGETNADLGSLTERYDAGTITGNGGGLVILTGTKASKGACTFTTITLSSAAVAAFGTIALQSADQTFGQKTLIVNNRRHSMPILVKQSTAQNFSVFMADSADGKTGKTGLTLAVTLKKGGETSFSSISPTVTEIGNGHYDIALTTTHMNTVGLVSLRATATGADPADCPNCIDVVGIDKTDAAALGLSRLDAAITTRLAPTTAGRTLDVAATGEAGLDFDNIKQASGATTLTNIRVPNVTLTDTVTTYTGNTPQTGDNFARLGAPAGASVSADIAAINAKTTNLPADPADASDVAAAITAATAPLATAANLAIVAGYIDTEIATLTTNVGTILAAVDTEVAAVKAKTDQLTFTVANQVDANAVSGGGGMTLSDLLSYEYATGRTIVGFFRRVGASVEAARGLKGTTVEFLDQLGNVIWGIAQSVVAGTRGVINLGDTEDPP